MKIGAVLMLVELNGLKRALTFSEIRDTALLCEELGLDSVWVYDHLLYRMGKKKTAGIWEGWSMLAALAALQDRSKRSRKHCLNMMRWDAITSCSTSTHPHQKVIGDWLKPQPCTER